MMDILNMIGHSLRAEPSMRLQVRNVLFYFNSTVAAPIYIKVKKRIR